jgi:hypothetical protein
MMIRIPKSVVSFGALVLVAGALTLAFPPAAHAVAAALVQVTNTVTTQDTSRQASQLVHLNVDLSSDLVSKFNLVTASGPIANYSVPTTASLVITSVDITPALDNTSASFTLHFGGGSSNAMNWAIPGQPSLVQFATIQFTYPSGIVIAPGFTPNIQMETNGSGNDVFIDMFGYLTNN